MNRTFENRSRRGEFAAPQLALTDAEVGATLRRQFIGSIFVAVAVMAAAGIVASRPAHDIGDGATHRVSIVQQPSFVAPADRVIALRQH
jgi:hypothetical protein